MIDIGEGYELIDQFEGLILRLESCRCFEEIEHEQMFRNLRYKHSQLRKHLEEKQ